MNIQACWLVELIQCALFQILRGLHRADFINLQSSKHLSNGSTLVVSVRHKITDNDNVLSFYFWSVADFFALCIQNLINYRYILLEYVFFPLHFLRYYSPHNTWWHAFLRLHDKMHVNALLNANVTCKQMITWIVDCRRKYTVIDQHSVRNSRHTLIDYDRNKITQRSLCVPVSSDWFWHSLIYRRHSLHNCYFNYSISSFFPVKLLCFDVHGTRLLNDIFLSAKESFLSVKKLHC